MQVNAAKIITAKHSPTSGLEDSDHLVAAEKHVATYVHNTLTVDADDEAAAATAACILNPASADQTVLIPRLRQLEAVGLVDIDDGKPVVAAPLRAAVHDGASRVTA